MAKYAMFSTPGHGHVNPTLALAQELVARSEQVIYYLTEEFRPAVEATGATFRPYSKEMFWDSQPNIPRQKADMSFVFGRMMKTLIQASTRMLPLLLEEMREAQIDCILYDTMC